MNKKILLTIAEPVYKKLELKMKQEGYLSIQELINAILRDGVLGTKQVSKKVVSVNADDKEFVDYFSEEG